MVIVRIVIVVIAFCAFLLSTVAPGIDDVMKWGELWPLALGSSVVLVGTVSIHAAAHRSRGRPKRAVSWWRGLAILFVIAAVWIEGAAWYQIDAGEAEVRRSGQFDSFGYDYNRVHQNRGRVSSAEAGRLLGLGLFLLAAIPVGMWRRERRRAQATVESEPGDEGSTKG